MLVTILLFAAIFSGLMSITSFYLFLGKRRVIKDKLLEIGATEKTVTNNNFALLSQRINGSVFGTRLASQLHRSNIMINSDRFLMLLFVTLIIVFYLVHLLLNIEIMLDFLLSAILVRIGVIKLLQMREKKIIDKVNGQLPEICRMLSSAVRAGLNIQQGIELVSAESKEPVGPLFRRLATELKLGTSLEQAIKYMLENVQSKELRLMGNTLIIQHKAGGNLGRILEEMARTLEMRERINQEIKSSTSESRFIALVLPFMPVLAAIILNLVIPGFIKPLFTLPGMILTMIFMTLLFTGFTLIRKVTDIKV